MNPHRFSLLTLSLAAVATGCGVEGNGAKTTELRGESGFRRVAINMDLDARITPADAFSIAITIDSNLQRHVTTRLRGDTLVVDEDQPLDFSGRAQAVITLPAFLGASLSSDGTVAISGFTPARDLEFDSSGGGHLAWEGLAARVGVSQSGGGRVELTGTADLLEAEDSASGDIDARALIARDARLSLSGSGSIFATVEHEVSRAAIAGSGNIELWGAAEVRDTDLDGSGAVLHH